MEVINNLIRSFELDPSLRPILADALEEAGRELEAKLLRSSLPVRMSSGSVRPELTVADYDGHDDTLGWVNCKWGQRRFGGVWVQGGNGIAYGGEGSVLDQDASRGDIFAYEGWHMTGGSLADVDWYTGLGLQLTDDEAAQLNSWVQEESLRVCRGAVERVLREADLSAVEAAFDGANGKWTGCDWTHPCEYNADPANGDAVPHPVHGCIGAETFSMTTDDADPVTAVVDEAMHSVDTEGWTGWQIDALRHIITEAAEAAQEYATQVAGAAYAAQRCGEQAVEAARDGDWDAALKYAEQACHHERQFGDCPTWRPLREAIETVRSRS